MIAGLNAKVAQAIDQWARRHPSEPKRAGDRIGQVDGGLLLLLVVHF